MLVIKATRYWDGCLFLCFETTTRYWYVIIEDDMVMNVDWWCECGKHTEEGYGYGEVKVGNTKRRCKIVEVRNWKRMRLFDD